MIRALAWSPDGKRIASGGFDRLVKIWAVDTGQEMLSLPGHGTPISCVLWSPDGQQLLTAGGREVKIWDATSGGARK